MMCWYIMAGVVALILAASNIGVGVYALKTAAKLRTLSKVVLCMGAAQILGQPLIAVLVSWTYVPGGTGLGLGAFWCILEFSSLLIVITNAPLIFLLVRLGNCRREEMPGNDKATADNGLDPDRHRQRELP